MFPKIVVPQNGWFITENPIKMDDLGGKPTIFGNIHVEFFAIRQFGIFRQLTSVRDFYHDFCCCHSYYTELFPEGHW